MAVPCTVAPSPWTRRLSALHTLLLSTGEGEQRMVRDCALDSGSITMDTEIVRITYIVTAYRRGGTDNGTRLCPGQWPSPWTRRLSAIHTLLLSTGEGEQIMVRGCALDSGPHHGHGDCPQYIHCYCLQARGNR